MSDEPVSGAQPEAQVIDGRFCSFDGGEFVLRRRLEGRALVTYLLCPFCGARKPTLRYDLDTREHTDLLKESAAADG